MPTNLLRTYNQLLELLYATNHQNLVSLRRVFDRDFNNTTPIFFRNNQVHPTPADGQNSLDQLFFHLTTRVFNEKTNARQFEQERSVRIHWIKFHIELGCQTPPKIFRVKDENRIYILDEVERYVIILEPFRNTNEYYLLTAFKLEDSNYRKILKKYQKRGELI